MPERKVGSELDVRSSFSNASGESKASVKGSCSDRFMVVKTIWVC